MHYLQRLNYIKDAVTHKASEAKEVVEDKATEVKDVTEDKVSEVRKAVSEAKKQSMIKLLK